jgi:hypothetical protein
MRYALLLFTLSLATSYAPRAQADAMERMGMEKLRATHEKVEAFKKQLQKVSLPSGYDDVRALLHVHSAFSHDSRGKIEDIVAAANKVGVRVILFTEHPASTYDYVNDGHRGLRDGVLLIPGAENGGFQAYPKTSIQDKKHQGPQEFSDLVRGTDGLIFLCHLEERMDWDIAGLTGSEIYNTHADFKDEAKLLAALRSPVTMLALRPALEQYPQETFAGLQDYPADYLKRWDQLCQKARLTGVSANDAHHNQAFRGRLLENGKVQLEDALGKTLARLDPEKIAPLKEAAAGKKAGDVVFELDFDPYERSFHHVSTHLLMHELTEANVREALQAGRAYVAFDWMADPSGFVLRADRGDETWPMGSEVPFAPGLHLRGEAPLEGKWRLMRDGEMISEQNTNKIDIPVDKPGNYRVEVWLTLAGEARPWILSNPIYVRGQ